LIRFPIQYLNSLVLNKGRIQSKCTKIPFIVKFEKEGKKMSYPSEELASFIVDTSYEDLPLPAVREVKYLLLDSIGCALAGIATEPGKMAVALARRLGGLPESSVIGTGDRVSCSNAVFANSQLISALDYDALMPGGHAPPYVIPPALAMAESKKVSGKELILATAIGFEVAARVAGALRPISRSEGSKMKNFGMGERGGAASANFGAVAGAGKILKLDREKITSALGVAGHLCQVLTNTQFTCSEHRAMTKYGVPGWQNTGAITAVLLAEMGYMGDTKVFDPEHGYWKFCGYEGWSPDKITEGLGMTWSFNRVSYKAYPCCGMIHTSIDCFLSIIEKNNLMPEDIESVRAFFHPVAEAPVFTSRELSNVVDIQFGLHYVLAVAAYRVRIGAEWQDLDLVRRPEILEFAKKVSFQEHPGFMKKLREAPGSHLGKVEVVARGNKYTEERVYSRGTYGTDLQMSEEELVEKFRHNASGILTQGKINGAVKALLELEKVENIVDLMKQVTL
jgi:2-methylcitrate dehydratase PrpD